MDFLKLAARRNLVGACGTIILCLVVALTVEGVIAGGRTDPKAFNVLPGQTLDLTDTMPRGAPNLSDIALTVSSPEIDARLVAVFSGFWLGGNLWRAQVDVPAAAPLGEYTVAVRYQNGTETNPKQKFTITVRKNAAAMQAASLSLATRATGVSPYLLAACLLPMALLPMGFSFILTRKISLALRQAGMAEIYRAMASPEGQRVFFTACAPVSEGQEVDVMDTKAHTVLGTAVIATVKGLDAEAIMRGEIRIRPGSLARPKTQ